MGRSRPTYYSTEAYMSKQRKVRELEVLHNMETGESHAHATRGERTKFSIVCSMELLHLLQRSQRHNLSGLRYKYPFVIWRYTLCDEGDYKGEPQIELEWDGYDGR